MSRFERYLPLALALVTAAFAVWAIEPWPVGVFQDDGIYAVLAKSLATGHGYRYLQMPGAPHATHYPPLYPAFLAMLWRLWPSFPENVVLFKFANAALAGAAAWFAFLFARRRLALGAVAASVATLAFTACAPVILLTVMVLSEPLFLAALFPVLFAAERAAESGRDREAIVAGAAGALLALVRTLGIVVVPATVLVLIARRRWRPAALVVAAALVVLVPWQLWVARHAAEVPPVFLGKYGSYFDWLGGALRAEGPAWVARLVRFNLVQVTSQGWATVTVVPFPNVIRWAATLALAALFAVGWWRCLWRAPVAAWTVAGYLGLVVTWPFMPARFTWGIWPMVGFIFAYGAQAVFSWRPAKPLVALRWSAIGVVALLAIGYVRYNWQGASRGWWTQVQQMTADRARPLAEWVAANTSPDAVIATDDDVLIHLYTGRRTIPNGAFTPQEHMKPQTPAFAAATLHTILRTYPVDYVLASTEYGTYAVRGLVQATPPELRIVRALSRGAVFATFRRTPGE